MTRILTVSLITLGDPGRLTGGYRYHRRMAELAPDCGAAVRFVSFPERPFPLPTLAGPAVLRQSRNDVLVLDSIAAAFLGPWLPRHRAAPLVGSLHQPPGGIDHGPLRRGVQASMDRLAYRRARLLLVASQALGDELAGQGYPPERIRVVPPGRDLPAAPAGPPVDLRQGRRAALLCVGNWVERKGILDVLEAVARLPAGLATLHLAGDDRADPPYGTGCPGRTWPAGWSSTAPCPPTRWPACTRRPTSSCSPASGSRTGPSGARPWPRDCRWSAGVPATSPTWPSTAGKGCWPARATLPA
jgi:glycosyltransferase involved in cell wall biosynthesis